MTPELSPAEVQTLIAYARKKYEGERFPYSAELRPLKEILDRVAPPRLSTFPSIRYYAPPKATAQQRRGRDPRR